MLICVCLRILASSRIPQYDLGRQTPHFLGGSVTEGTKAGKKRHKQHCQEATTDNDGSINERAGGSSTEHTAAAASNSRHQAQPTKGHFEKLLEETFPYHAYTIKHKLRDCSLMKSFINIGSLS
jgi:hypothetical protein